MATKGVNRVFVDTNILVYATVASAPFHTEARTTMRWLKLLDTIAIGGKQVYDANIVATMLANNLKQLLTHNTADFARFSSYVDVIPLKSS
jgi:predicted nucleic acid-binding protein